MSEFAGNLRRKFICFHHLGFDSSAHKVPEERESKNPQNIAGMEESNTVKIGETSTCPPKGSSDLQSVRTRDESFGAELGDEDRNLTMAEKDCVLTSSDDDVEDLSAFVAETLQWLSEGSVEKLIAEECVNVEEFLCGDAGVEKDGGDKRHSVCPDVTIGGDVDVDDRSFFPEVAVDPILREELGSTNVTSTPKKAVWPIHSKRRSSVLKEPDEPVCKAVVFDVASGSGTVGGTGLSKGNDTNTSEGVPESFVASGGFSALEGIAQRQVDERFVVARVGSEREGMVRIPPVDEMLGARSCSEREDEVLPQSVGEK